MARRMGKEKWTRWRHNGIVFDDVIRILGAVAEPPVSFKSRSLEDSVMDSPGLSKERPLHNLEKRRS